ncbi:MAG: beta-propeller fold lactonase family protein [Bacteroidetes bacterium]|nr:beta-propeller fold lactonase family protein [Bacteroidota bacterium]
MKFVVAIVFALGLAGCVHESVTPQYSGNYPPAVAAVISQNCLGGSCHSGRNALNDSLDMTTWQTMMLGSRYEYDVIPYIAAKSHCFEHVNTNPDLAAEATPRMPLSRNPLSEADQRTIFDWINHGAPSATGQIAYSNSTHRVYALSEGEDRMTIIDDDARRIVRMTLINADADALAPSCFCPMPDKQSVIVGAVNAKGSIRKYSLPDLAQTAELASNYYINDLTLTPDGAKGYITDYPPSGLQRVGVFDPVAMQFTRSISMNGMTGPYGMAPSGDGAYVYVSGAQSDNIAKIDTKTDQIVKLFPVADDVPSPLPDGYNPKYSPGFMTMSADGKTLYVSCRNSSEVVRIDVATDSVTGRVSIPFTPYRSTLSPDGSELWVTAWTTNSVQVVDTHTLTVTAKVDSINTNPRQIAFSRDGAVAYVCCEKLVGGIHNHGLNGGAPPSGIYVIDTRTKKIIYGFAGPGYTTQIIPGF